MRRNELPIWRDQRVHLKTEIPGPKSLELRAREDRTLAPGLQGYATMSGIVADHAEGSAIVDVDGNTFLDLIGGIGVGALGHSHPAVTAAITEQVAKISVGSLTSTARVELGERVASHAPRPGLDRLQLYTSGAEAVESALRLARAYTGGYETVSFWGGFHGKTAGAMSLLGTTGKRGLGPFMSGAHHIPYADCYRCPLSLQHPSCGVACVELGRKQLKAASSGQVAAVIVEPMQGTAGNVIPPDDFLPAVRSLADEYGALLIADEMITGFGRTGRYWGIDHSGVRPDIVTLGKAFGGGFPLSGVLTTTEIASTAPWSLPSGSSSSYGGNALGAAAGVAALRAIDDGKLVENSARVGALLLRELEVLAADVPFIGHVSGRGMFLRIELVRDRATKEPLPRSVTERIFRALVARGLFTMAYAASFRLQPALTLDEATAKNAVAILREVFDEIAGEGSWRAA